MKPETRNAIAGILVIVFVLLLTIGIVYGFEVGQLIIILRKLMLISG